MRAAASTMAARDDETIGSAVATEPPPDAVVARTDVDARCLRIVAWNIGLHGLVRTLALFFDRSLKRMMDALDADVLCLNEVKNTRAELPELGALADGCLCFFSFNRALSMYSGVATIVRKDVPVLAVYEGLTGIHHVHDQPSVDAGVLHYTACTKPSGRCLTTGPAEETPRGGRFSRSQLDAEGRALVTDHGAFVLFNVYMPASSHGATDATAAAERAEFKARFHDQLCVCVRDLSEAGRRVVVVGDLNVAATPLDHVKDVDDGPQDTPSETQRWFQRMAAPQGVCVDAFRHIHGARPDAFTCWSSVTSARLTNYGARLDYTLVHSDMAPTDELTLTPAPQPPSVFDFTAGAASASSASSTSTALTDAAVRLHTSYLTKYASELDAWRKHYLTNAQRVLQHVDAPRLVDADIMPWIQGSDHCPVTCVLMLPFPRLTPELSQRNMDSMSRHALCSSAFPEFAKRQRQLRTFLEQRRPAAPPEIAVSSTPKELTAVTSGAKRPRQQSMTAFLPKAQPTTPSATPSFHTPEAVVVIEDDESPESELELNSSAPQSSASASVTAAWTNILTGPLAPPLCSCGIVCVERTVIKDGPSLGRKFFVCSRPQGRPGDPKARCNFFLWFDDHRKRSRVAGGSTVRQADHS